MDANSEFRELLERSGWSQAEASRRLELTSADVSRYMTGKHPPDKQTLRLFKILLAGHETHSDSVDAMREQPSQGDADIWRKRAKAAEQELAELKGGMRALLDRSSSSSLKAKKEGVMAVFQTLTREQQQEVLVLARRIQENKT